MAKLAILAAALVALLALAEASTITTTMTTTTIEEENPSGSRQRCQEQIQRQQLRSCQRYLTQGRPYDELGMRMVVNPQQQSLRQCCQQLENVDEQCRCEAIRQVVRQQQQQGTEMQGERMQEMGRPYDELLNPQQQSRHQCYQQLENMDEQCRREGNGEAAATACKVEKCRRWCGRHNTHQDNVT
ncbi:hypothetical protein RJ640_004629 [Escallonia rubra]|uniref:Bifunctional inhibitor/plant lipid transfer protein/seed storage helical domain-containing protein n=1 Tax=Escallonia rubra TaxID=112253 RepID=A0AA88RFX5_9ASTE|nr:hypothetical protein RJ640_004629 [Escallonia rubra]